MRSPGRGVSDACIATDGSGVAHSLRGREPPRWRERRGCAPRGPTDPIVALKNQTIAAIEAVRTLLGAPCLARRPVLPRDPEARRERGHDAAAAASRRSRSTDLSTMKSRQSGRSGPSGSSACSLTMTWKFHDRPRIEARTPRVGARSRHTPPLTTERPATAGPHRARACSSSSVSSDTLATGPLSGAHRSSLSPCG
jgi:hypothetical protein